MNESKRRAEAVAVLCIVVIVAFIIGYAISNLIWWMVLG